MNTLFFVLNTDFTVAQVTNASVEGAIVIRGDSLQYLGVSQLVQIAKSMNSELKVNNKQAREIILAAINEELNSYPVTIQVKKVTTTTSKDICFAAFDKIDMNDKPLARTLVETLEKEHNIPKRVVQSYASNYRKANA